MHYENRPEYREPEKDGEKERENRPSIILAVTERTHSWPGKRHGRGRRERGREGSMYV